MIWGLQLKGLFVNGVLFGAKKNISKKGGKKGTGGGREEAESAEQRGAAKDPSQVNGGVGRKKTQSVELIVRKKKKKTCGGAEQFKEKGGQQLFFNITSGLCGWNINAKALDTWGGAFTAGRNSTQKGGSGQPIRDKRRSGPQKSP